RAASWGWRSWLWQWPAWPGTGFCACWAGRTRGTIMAERKVLVYTRFNRLWHWSQATSILILLFTGLRIMGLHGVLTFGTAVTIHSIVAVALMLLWVFTGFWLMTTGAWRQFAPRRAGLWQV